MFIVRMSPTNLLNIVALLNTQIDVVYNRISKKSFHLDPNKFFPIFSEVDLDLGFKKTRKSTKKW